MTEVKRIFMIVVGPWVLLACLRGAWLQWQEPLRERTVLQRWLLRSSALGVPKGKVVHTRLRTGPTRAITAFFVLLGAELIFYGVRNNTVFDAAFGAAGVAAVVWALVALFNRPRWAVPPAVRGEPGMFEYERRRPQPQPEFRDPRAVPPPSQSKTTTEDLETDGSRSGESPARAG